MHEVLVNRLGGLSLPRKIVDRFTDRPDMPCTQKNNTITTMSALMKDKYNYTVANTYDLNVHVIRYQ